MWASFTGVSSLLKGHSRSLERVFKRIGRPIRLTRRREKPSPSKRFSCASWEAPASPIRSFHGLAELSYARAVRGHRRASLANFPQLASHAARPPRIGVEACCRNRLLDFRNRRSYRCRHRGLVRRFARRARVAGPTLLARFPLLAAFPGTGYRLHGKLRSRNFSALST